MDKNFLVPPSKLDKSLSPLTSFFSMFASFSFLEENPNKVVLNYIMDSFVAVIKIFLVALTSFLCFFTLRTKKSLVAHVGDAQLHIMCANCQTFEHTRLYSLYNIEKFQVHTLSAHLSLQTTQWVRFYNQGSDLSIGCCSRWQALLSLFCIY